MQLGAEVGEVFPFLLQQGVKSSALYHPLQGSGMRRPICRARLALIGVYQVSCDSMALHLAMLKCYNGLALAHFSQK